jgi:Copper amine oxidase N-terminal domain
MIVTATIAGSAATVADSVRIVVNDHNASVPGDLIRAGRVLVALCSVNDAVRPAGKMGAILQTPTGNALAEIFRAMRAPLQYEPSTRKILVSRGHAYPTMRTLVAAAIVGSKQLTITTLSQEANRQLSETKSVRTLRVAPMLIAGTVYVPIRDISEALGAYVEWLPARKTVALRVLPPSDQELAAEAAALAKIKAMGLDAQQRLNNAAGNLK